MLFIRRNWSLQKLLSHPVCGLVKEWLRQEWCSKEDSGWMIKSLQTPVHCGINKYPQQSYNKNLHQNLDPDLRLLLKYFEVDKLCIIFVPPMYPKLDLCDHNFKKSNLFFLHSSSFLSSYMTIGTELNCFQRVKHFSDNNVNFLKSTRHEYTFFTLD